MGPKERCQFVNPNTNTRCRFYARYQCRIRGFKYCMQHWKGYVKFIAGPGKFHNKKLYEKKEYEETDGKVK